MADLYQVIDWDRCFETHRTREKDSQSHCLVPNKQNGEGYTQLLTMENGESLYGAFHALILFLSKQPARNRDGYLTEDGTKDGKRITPAELASMIKFSEITVKSMLDTITGEIGWIANHSLSKQKEAVAYPGKRVDLKFIIMAQKFHNDTLKQYPQENTLQKRIKARTDLAAARELEHIHIEKQWPVDKIQSVLDWIPTSPFWYSSCRVLIGISNESRRNGALKIENVHAQMVADFKNTLLTFDQVQEEIREKKTSSKDYEEIPNAKKGESLWRRKKI